MVKSRFEIGFEQAYLEAKDDGVEEQLEDELYSFANLLDSNYELKLFLEDPRVSSEYKKKMLKKIFPEEISRNFSSIIFRLIDYGREELLGELSRNFTKRLSRDKDVLFGKVLSVYEIPPKLKKQIEKAVRDLGNCKVKLRYSKDPDLLGGFSVGLIDGEVWDVSLRHKLNSLKAAILN